MERCGEAQLRWVRPDWLAEAQAWVRAELDLRGIALRGEPEQPHVRWWSTVLRFPTSDGDLYFKAIAPVHAFEVALTRVLASSVSDRVPKLVAVDAQRGWMLMRDGGRRLREVIRSAADLGRWVDVLPLYAELQIDFAPRREELLSLGVPDQGLADLPGQFERLLDEPDAWRLDEPQGLTGAEYERLRAAVPELAGVCRDLVAFGIPETIQHDDLHDGNVFVDDGRYVFFDWGDSCISHPFHTLVVTLRSIAHGHQVEPGSPELERLRDAYFEPWTRQAPRADLAAPRRCRTA